ncbi:hypothetical protein ACFLRZ_00565 [Bacteroidota bacterium]
MQQLNNHFDNQVRNKLENLEMTPPEIAWSSIKSSINEGPQAILAKRGLFNLRNFLTAISILVMTIVIVLLSTVNNQNTTGEKNEFINRASVAPFNVEQELLESDYDINEVMNEQIVQNAVLVSDPTEKIAEKILASYQDKNVMNSSESLLNEKLAYNPIVEDKIALDQSTTNSRTNQNTESVVAKLDIAAEKVPLQAVIIKQETPFLEKEKTTIENNPGSNYKNDPSSTEKKSYQNELKVNSPLPANDYVLRDKWAIGVHYTPDWITYPLWPDEKFHGYSVDANIYRQWKDFNIQIGVGVSKMEDLGSFVVDYSKWDVVGGYQKVDSMTFDTVLTEVIPKFYTSTVHLFDSVEYNEKSNIRNEYTYLQIPILAGFKLFEYERFSAYIYGGPVLSLMISKKEPEWQNTAGDITLLNLENETPVRINTNIQVWGSLEFGYALTNRIRLTAEPLVKYYISPVYDKTTYTNKNPYAMGLRMGVKWSF